MKLFLHIMAVVLLSGSAWGGLSQDDLVDLSCNDYSGGPKVCTISKQKLMSAIQNSYEDISRVFDLSIEDTFIDDFSELVFFGGSYLQGYKVDFFALSFSISPKGYLRNRNISCERAYIANGFELIATGCEDNKFSLKDMSIRYETIRGIR